MDKNSFHPCYFAAFPIDLTVELYRGDFVTTKQEHKGTSGLKCKDLHKNN